MCAYANSTAPVRLKQQERRCEGVKYQEGVSIYGRGYVILKLSCPSCNDMSGQDEFQLEWSQVEVEFLKSSDI